MATGLASWARPTAVASTSRRCEPLGSDCGLRVTHDRGLGFRKRAKHAFAARNRNKYGRGQGHGHKIQCVASLMTGALLAKYAAAGGVGACVSHAGAVPLDVVTTADWGSGNGRSTPSRRATEINTAEDKDMDTKSNASPP